MCVCVCVCAMMSLNVCQTCSPADNLQISLGRNFVHRAKKAKKIAKNRENVWEIGNLECELNGGYN